MKTQLKLSILLNAALLMALGIALARHENQMPAPAAPAALVNSIPEARGDQPFRWSQLESTNNYRDYVANLRAVGCPEPTVRAIVTADFETASSFERRQRQLAGENATPFSPETTRQAIVDALGNDAAPSQIESFEATAGSMNALHPQATTPRPTGHVISRASYPVVFQNSVLNDTTLMENQKAAVRQMQQQFVDAIGGPNQNSADPSYAARWQIAQRDADDALRAQLGSQSYLSYKLQHYYSNFQQAMLNAGDSPVTIDPEQLAK